jgi:NADH-quinone oxidoreductase subunit M
VDGLSILLVLLTTFLTPISILSTWTAVEDRVKDFMMFFLLLEVGMVGVFLAQDLFLFLRLLGVHPGADVLPDRHLGRPKRMYAASSSSSTPWQARS